MCLDLIEKLNELNLRNYYEVFAESAFSKKKKKVFAEFILILSKWTVSKQYLKAVHGRHYPPKFLSQQNNNSINIDTRPRL